MKELSVSQAQKQFISLLSQLETKTIIDKKSHVKKAVLMPYHLYEKLISSDERRLSNDKEELEQFVGLLSSDYKTDDAKYNAIIK